jgi:two-component system, NtrC family, response regulator
MKPSLLMVDDDEEIRTQMKWALAAEYNVAFAGDRAEALHAFRNDAPAAVLLDLGLPPNPNAPTEGFATLRTILEENSNAKVIIVSGQGDKRNALEAVAAGAYDFLIKPVDVSELKHVLKRCLYVADLEREYRELQQASRPEIFEDMLGTSPQMQGVFSFIRKVASTSAPVLLLGESGTGKEMAAQAIHRRSTRSSGPFVPINCNAIPENLLESELFGHEKGSFTGAHMQRRGLIETAAGGTIFLDEIGDLPSAIQVKLLRFLQEQTFTRVGGRQEIKADARVVAATNADLKNATATGKFREDLYFRLAVVVIKLPPLRDRGEDLVLVAREFLQRAVVECDRPKLTFAPDAVRAINSHAWPGNVRELQNRIKRAVIMADGKRITAQDLELAGGDEVIAPTTLREAREAAERELVTRALKRHNGRITAAASDLGISRPTLYELMEKLGLAKRGATEASSTNGGEPG